MKLRLKRWLRLALTPRFLEVVDGNFGRWFPISPATRVLSRRSRGLFELI